MRSRLKTCVLGYDGSLLTRGTSRNTPSQRHTATADPAVATASDASIFFPVCRRILALLDPLAHSDLMPLFYRLRRRGRRRQESRLVGWLSPIPDKATLLHPTKRKLRCYCRGSKLGREKGSDLTVADMDDPESRAQSDPPEGSELDAEGEEVDEEFEQTLANGFITAQDNTTSDNENAQDGPHEAKELDDVSENEESSSASSVSEENEWQGSSHSEEDAESKTVDTNRCV
jgi:hypothetical protein